MCQIMTEASENAYLVRVRAQVMTRDEGTGGWMALGGGGLADVMVGKRARYVHTSLGGDSSNGDTSSSISAPSHDYYIHGKRISDNMVVLECTIKKDFQYNKVMPTFHHWVTDEKRFGLTFQTAADARAFDKGVRTAIEELLDGLGGVWPSLHAYKKYNPAPKDDDEDQNIFECLNLPSESHSSSENSTTSRARRLATNDHSLTQTPILSVITLPRHGADGGHPLQDPLKHYESEYDKIDVSDPDKGPYVSLSAIHEYQYPSLPAVTSSSEKSSPNTKPPLLKQDSGSIKLYGPPPLPDKRRSDQDRFQCRHCQLWYLESRNCKGACEYAPDGCQVCVNTITCIRCAQCLLYHCISEESEDEMSNPCICDPQDPDCSTRWIGLSLLSLVVPCLWCYLPLRYVHRSIRQARLTGGRHSPMGESPKNPLGTPPTPPARN